MKIKKYITMKIENRSICSEVISVKLFCREKGFKNVLYFYFILFVFLQINFYAYVNVFFTVGLVFPLPHSLGCIGIPVEKAVR